MYSCIIISFCSVSYDVFMYVYFSLQYCVFSMYLRILFLIPPAPPFFHGYLSGAAALPLGLGPTVCAREMIPGVYVCMWSRLVDNPPPVLVAPGLMQCSMTITIWTTLCVLIPLRRIALSVLAIAAYAGVVLHLASSRLGAGATRCSV